MSSTETTIRKQIASQPILLYMKGTPSTPKCGFSKAAVEALNAAGQPFAYVDVLEAPFIREKLPSISQWPTFPQLFVSGELIGGSDVVCDMAADNSLAELLQNAEPRPLVEA